MKGIVCTLLYSHGNGPFARCIDVISELSHIYRDIPFLVIVPEVSLSSPQRDYLQNEGKLPLNVSLFTCPQLKRALAPLQALGQQPYISSLTSLPQLISKSQSYLDESIESGLLCFPFNNGKSVVITKLDIDFFLVREMPLITSSPAFDISYGPQSLIYTHFVNKYCPKVLSVQQACQSVASKYLLAEQSRHKLMVSLPSSIFSLDLETNQVSSLCSTQRDFCFIPPVVSLFSGFDLNNQNSSCQAQLFQSHQTIYIYNSGTRITSRFFAENKFLSFFQDFSVYSNRHMPDLGCKHSVIPPSSINNIFPTFVLSRAGWGMAWFCLFNQIPLVLFKPTKFDDPEIWCNYELLLSTGLALSEDILIRDVSLLHNLSSVRSTQLTTSNSLRKFFGKTTPGHAIVNDNYFSSLI